MFCVSNCQVDKKALSMDSSFILFGPNVFLPKMPEITFRRRTTIIERKQSRTKKGKQQFAPPPHCHCRLGENEMPANYVETWKQLECWKTFNTVNNLFVTQVYEKISQESRLIKDHLCGTNSPVMLLRADSGRGRSAPAKPLKQNCQKMFPLFCDVFNMPATICSDICHNNFVGPMTQYAEGYNFV